MNMTDRSNEYVFNHCWAGFYFVPIDTGRGPLAETVAQHTLDFAKDNFPTEEACKDPACPCRLGGLAGGPAGPRPPAKSVFEAADEMARRYRKDKASARLQEWFERECLRPVRPFPPLFSAKSLDDTIRETTTKVRLAELELVHDVFCAFYDLLPKVVGDSKGEKELVRKLRFYAGRLKMGAEALEREVDPESFFARLGARQRAGEKNTLREAARILRAMAGNEAGGPEAHIAGWLEQVAREMNPKS
jgi:hypothetical protein